MLYYEGTPVGGDVVLGEYLQCRGPLSSQVRGAM